MGGSPNRGINRTSRTARPFWSLAGELARLFEQVIHVTPQDDAKERNALIIATVVVGVVAAIYFVLRAVAPVHGRRRPARR